MKPLEETSTKQLKKICKNLEKEIEITIEDGLHPDEAIELRTRVLYELNERGEL